MESTCKKDCQRLPTNVIPELYQIELKPDLEEFTFTGKETIIVDVKEETNLVALNVRDVTISEASYHYSESDHLKGDVSIDTDEEKAYIKFCNLLRVGKGSLRIKFDGILNDKMAGFYRCKYITSSGEQRYSATTQFEATDARRAFPCWDEPVFKAVFEITLIVPKDRIALSNCDPVEEAIDPDDPELRVVRFARTPIMSTYLVGFVIGEYDFVESKTTRGTRVRVYTPIGRSALGSFALDVACKCLTLFEDYFNIPYPLAKLDHIAIPDFASGAMENWGLITYRETRILADPENTATQNLIDISKTIAHEIAHQWFGNLVTMKWWTDLWLKEGFARFLEHFSINTINPKFDIWNQFVNTVALRAFRLDSLRNSHPIEVPVNHPQELEAIFDEISYDKGACLIRMCHQWVGQEAFKEGLRQYLRDHSYDNAVTQDLWSALGKSSGLPVGQTMSGWTQQMGYPVVSVEAKKNGSETILTFKQSKFTLDSRLSPEEESILWMIPIFIVTSDNPSKILNLTLLTKKSDEFTLTNLSSQSWIKLNPSINGFYRVNYSADMLNTLKPAIQSHQLGPSDRMNILNDTFALVMSGHVSTIAFFDLLDSYTNEDSYVVWSTIDACFNKLGILLSYTDFHFNICKLGIQLYEKIFDKLGFDADPNESLSDNLLRAIVLNRLVDFKYGKVLLQALDRFSDHSNGKPCHPDIRKAVYKAVAVTCDDLTYDELLEMHNTIDLQEEKVRIVTSIGATSDLKKIKKLLDFAFSTAVRSQDAWMIIVYIGTTKIGRDEGWKFFKTNADEFKRRYGCHYALGKLIEHLISGFSTQEELQDAESFFKDNPFPGQETIIARSFEIIKANIAWLSRESESVKEFLFAKFGNFGYQAKYL